MESKKNVAIFLFFAVLILGGIFMFAQIQDEPAEITGKDYFRIHIRANSNLETDQRVKYEVKDAVVSALAPLLEQATSKTLAQSIVRGNLGLVETAANAVLDARGYSYISNAVLAEEYFPTRNYAGFTLESGVYDSLILNLGSGTGDNWWCVVYPPLCFVEQNGGTGAVLYKSKLLDIIKKFFE